MKVKEAVAEVMADSPLSRYAIARSLGKSDNYIYNIMGKDGTLTLETVLSIADVCEYDVGLIKRDGTKTVVIDPPSSK